MKPLSWLDIFRSKRMLSRTTSTPTMSSPSASAFSPSKDPNKKSSKNKQKPRANKLPRSHKSQYELPSKETPGLDFEIFEDPRCAICDGDLPPAEGRKYFPSLPFPFSPLPFILIPQPSADPPPPPTLRILPPTSHTTQTRALEAPASETTRRVARGARSGFCTGGAATGLVGWESEVEGRD